MLDQIQLLLSLEVLGFCVFGGVTLLLRSRDNRAKRILGGSMFTMGLSGGDPFVDSPYYVGIYDPTGLPGATL